jgi:hypothetical protein
MRSPTQKEKFMRRKKANADYWGRKRPDIT